jgi:hypothetical protein
MTDVNKKLFHTVMLLLRVAVFFIGVAISFEVLIPALKYIKCIGLCFK